MYISNLARLPQEDKSTLDLSLSLDDFNKTISATKLIHLIKEEKPYFLSKVVPSDLTRVICVKSKMNNSRILSQSGAFLLFGLNATLPENGSSEIRIERIDIKADEKKKILKELDSLSINESTAFPYIENSARYISRKYSV